MLQESKINTLTTEDTLDDPEYLQTGGYSLYPMHDSLRLLDAHLIFEPLLSCLGVMPQQMISNFSGTSGKKGYVQLKILYFEQEKTYLAYFL